MDELKDKNDSTPSVEDLLKEIRTLKRKLLITETNFSRTQLTNVVQNRVETILNDSFRKELMFFQLTLENANDILLFLDFDGRFAYASDAFLKVADIANFGLISGHHFRNVLEPLIPKEILNKLSKIVDDFTSQISVTPFEEQIDLIFKGKSSSFVVRITPMIDDNNKNIGIMVLFNDVTEITNALKAERRANQAKSEFLANMSHEIRTPINAIIGMTAIGKSSTDMERVSYCLSRIEDASNHLLGVISDILDMSKIEANKLELSPIEFVFEDMLRRVINVVHFRVDEKQQKLTIHVDSAIPKILIGDDHRLAQVITNLMGNAVKFTPSGGAISLNTRLIDEENDICTIQFDITDTGIGISQEQQARLFISFQQAESSTTRTFGGTGLGLAISKSIVETMGGKIWINSELEKGSTFSFTVQVKRGAEILDAQQVDVENNNTAVSFAKNHILLVDDVEINREILLALLEPIHLKIDCAENGAEAVRMFNEAPGKYDMIFMDIQMPIMDGYEATQRIRALDIPYAKEIPIVAMTANVFKEDIENCLKAGMSDHVGKPFNFDDVLETLQKYLTVKD